MAQRAVIDALCPVRLDRQPKGRLKCDLVTRRELIDPATVDIDWKRYPRRNSSMMGQTKLSIAGAGECSP